MEVDGKGGFGFSGSAAVAGGKGHCPYRVQKSTERSRPVGSSWESHAVALKAQDVRATSRQHALEDLQASLAGLAARKLQT